MQSFFQRIRRGCNLAWTGLRQWSGDAAYERYLECARRKGAANTLSESDFYVEQLNRRYSRPNRCC
jgi:uncharacterized short protein YbdD (DUF466 family)